MEIESKRKMKGYDLRVDDNFKTRRMEHATNVIIEFVEFVQEL